MKKLKSLLELAGVMLVCFGIPVLLFLAIGLVFKILNYKYNIRDVFSLGMTTSGYALTIGLTLVLIVVVLVSVLFRSVNKELKEATAANRLLLLLITICTFGGVVFLWMAVGLFPGWYTALRLDNTAEEDEQIIQRLIPVVEEWDVIIDKPETTIKDRHSYKLAKALLDELRSGNAGTPADPSINPGVLGDQFGMANALFSALALAGIVLAVLLQTLELKYQRAELRSTRGVFMNNYHLQAIQTIINSLSEDEKELRESMIIDLRKSVKYMRETNELDENQMRPIRERTAEVLSDPAVKNALESLFSLGQDDRYSTALKIADELTTINERNLGNGIMKDLLEDVEAIVERCRTTKVIFKGLPQLDGKSGKSLEELIGAAINRIDDIVKTYKAK